MNDLLLLHVSTDTPSSGAASQPSSMTCSASRAVTTSGMKVNVTCGALMCIQLGICCKNCTALVMNVIVVSTGTLHSDVARPPSPNKPKTCPSEHTTTGMYHDPNAVTQDSML